jgi:PAS domain S-box-containing protein
MGFIFAIVGVLFVEKIILSRLLKLNRELSNIGEGGNFLAKVGVEGNDELSNLSISINKMLSNLEMSMTELKYNEEQYRAIFENTGSATFIIDDDMMIILVNSEFEERTGYLKDEVEGKLKWIELFGEKEAERIIEIHNKRKNGDTQKSYEINFVDREGNMKDFLSVVERIQNSKRTVISLIDMTEQIAATKALLESNSKLQEMDRLKTDFLSTVSHELRTPLTSILGFAKIIKKKLDIIIPGNIVQTCKPNDHSPANPPQSHQDHGGQGPCFAVKPHGAINAYGPKRRIDQAKIRTEQKNPKNHHRYAADHRR